MMFHMLSRISMSMIFLIATNLNSLPTCLLPKLKMHGEQIQNESISWDSPRVGETRSVALHWVAIGQHEVLKIGKNSRAKSKLPNDCSSTSRFKKLLTKNKGLESSWIRLINTNYSLLKPSSTMINNVSILTTYGMCFIPHSIQLFIVKLMSRFLMKYLKNQPLLGSHFQRKSSELL